MLNKPKKEKKLKSDSVASVGPVEGELVATPDVPAKAPAPKAAPAVDRVKVREKLVDLFSVVEKALLDTNTDKKQPRQLRWALKSLDAAKDAALRHVQHNG